MNVNGVDGLFPLTKLNPRLVGYFINAKGEVFSTRQHLVPKQMRGNQNASGRYYSLQQMPNANSPTSFPVSERADELLRKAKQHSDFIIDTTLGSKPEPPPLNTFGIKAEGRDHAPSTQVGLVQKGYIIGQLVGDALVFGSKPKVHLSETSARAEVERLAHKSPDTLIVYLKVMGMARMNGIDWK